MKHNGVNVQWDPSNYKAFRNQHEVKGSTELHRTEDVSLCTQFMVKAHQMQKNKQKKSRVNVCYISGSQNVVQDPILVHRRV